MNTTARNRRVRFFLSYLCLYDILAIPATWQLNVKLFSVCNINLWSFCRFVINIQCVTARIYTDNLRRCFGAHTYVYIYALFAKNTLYFIFLVIRQLAALHFQ